MGVLVDAVNPVQLPLKLFLLVQFLLTSLGHRGVVEGRTSHCLLLVFALTHPSHGHARLLEGVRLLEVGLLGAQARTLQGLLANEVVSGRHWGLAEGRWSGDLGTHFDLLLDKVEVARIGCMS